MDDEYVSFEDVCFTVQDKENIPPEKVVARIAENQKELAEMCAVLSMTNMVRYGKTNKNVFKAIAEAALEFVVARQKGIDPNEMLKHAMDEANRMQKELLKKCMEYGVPHSVASLNYTNEGMEVDDSEKNAEQEKKRILDA